MPTSPVRHRHTAATVAEAQRLFACGWTPYAITQIFRRRGIPLGKNTVAGWVDPALAERRRVEAVRRMRIVNARRSRGRLGAGPPRSPEFRMERMRSLRALGVSFSAIARVMTFDFPEEPISEEQARYAINRDEIPPTYRGVGLRKVAA